MGAEIFLDQIPVLDEVWGLAERKYIPGGTRANLKFLDDAVIWDPKLSDTAQLVLCDAQTSGGLLIAVDPSESDRLIEELEKRGTPAAHRIGRIVEDPSARIRVRKVRPA